mgnify:FL=1
MQNLILNTHLRLEQNLHPFITYKKMYFSDIWFLLFKALSALFGHDQLFTSNSDPYVLPKMKFRVNASMKR